MEQHGENHKVLGFWQTRKFKILVFMAFVFCICIGLFIYLFSSTSSALDTLTNKDKIKASTFVSSSSKKNTLQIPTRFIAPTNSDIEQKICYESVWVNNNVVTYKLNNGHYAYNPNYLIERCSRSFTNRTDKNL